MKFPKKPFLFSLAFLLFNGQIKAETFVYDRYQNLRNIYRVTTSETGTSWELITTSPHSYNDAEFNFYDQNLNKIFSYDYGAEQYNVFDLDTNLWSTQSTDDIPSTVVFPHVMATTNVPRAIDTNTSNISSNTLNINMLGDGVAGSTALTAALAALPQTTKESKLSCGVGTGAYSSRYAFSFGCASKLNERFDVNAGGSYVFGGSKSYGGGTLDNSVVKAGFVFKLGELDKPTEISLKDKKIIDNKISNLQKDNKNLKAKNDEIISQNKRLLARLEKLENIALKFQVNNDVISMSK